MTSEKRKQATSKPSKRGRRRDEGSRDKLADDFLVDLYRSWQLHGCEMLDRLSAERPKVIFKAMVKLAQVLHSAVGERKDFDRRRNREEVLQRLQKLR